MRIYRYAEFKKLILEKSITTDDLFGSDKQLDNLKKLQANITSLFAWLKDSLFGSNIKNKLARLAYDYGMTKRIDRDVKDLDSVLQNISEVLKDQKILNNFDESSDNDRKYQDVVNFAKLGYKYVALKKDFVGVMNSSEDMGDLMSKIDKDAKPVSESIIIDYQNFINESLLLESSPKKDKFKGKEDDENDDVKDEEKDNEESEENSEKVKADDEFNFESESKEELNKELTAIIVKMDQLLVDYFNKFKDIRVDVEKESDESDESETTDDSKNDSEKDSESKKKSKNVSGDDEEEQKKDKSVSGDEDESKKKDKGVNDDSTNESFLNESAPPSNLGNVKFKDTYDKNDINNNPLKLWVEGHDLDVTDEILVRNNIMVRIMEAISVMTYHNVKYNFKYNFNDDVIKDFTQFKPEKRLVSIKEKADGIINGVKNEEKQKKYRLLQDNMIKHFDDSIKQDDSKKTPLDDKLKKETLGYYIFDTNDFFETYSNYTKELDSFVKEKILNSNQTYKVVIKKDSNMVPFYFSKIGSNYLVSHYIKKETGEMSFFVICDENGKEIKMGDSNQYKNNNYVKGLKLYEYTIKYDGDELKQQLGNKLKPTNSTVENIVLINSLKSLTNLSSKGQYITLIPSSYFGSMNFEGKVETKTT